MVKFTTLVYNTTSFDWLFCLLGDSFLVRAAAQFDLESSYSFRGRNLFRYKIISIGD
jgi:hypothetical protein